MTPQTLAWIEKQKPTLVEWAERYVQETELFEPVHPDRNRSPAMVSGSQLRNLLNAAQAGSSLPVLINFLRYQIGRERQGWKHRPSGERLEGLLDKELRELAKEGSKVGASELHELEAHLAAQFLGFIIHEYTYRCALRGTRT